MFLLNSSMNQIGWMKYMQDCSYFIIGWSFNQIHNPEKDVVLLF